MKRMIWLLAFLISFMMIPDITSAHAHLKQSNPSDNTKLEAPLKNISLEFSESIQPAFHTIELFDEGGNIVDVDDSFIPDGEETTLVSKVKHELSEGAYTIKWRVVSSDGHPIEGTIPFIIGEGMFQKSTIEDTAAYSPGLDKILLQGMQYLSFSLLIGFLFFQLWLIPRKSQCFFNNRLTFSIWAAYSLLAISILLSLPLQTTTDAAVTWSSVLTSSLLKETVLHTTFGTIWMIEIILLAILFISLRQTKTKIPAAYVSFLIVMVLMLCKASIGHTSAANNQVLAVIMNFIHLLGMALWLGNLLAIMIILPGMGSKSTEENKGHSLYWKTIQRFSKLAIIFVLMLLVTGIYASLQHVPSMQALVSTQYGKVLIGKMLLMLAMLGFGAYHFFRGRFKEKELGPSVLIEFSIGLLIIILAAILTNLPTANAFPTDFSQTETIGNYEFSLELTPSQVGENTVIVQVTDNNRQALSIEQITATLVSQDMNMVEGNVSLEKTAPGTYEATPIISMEGAWIISIHVLTKDYESVDADFHITISNPN